MINLAKKQSCPVYLLKLASSEAWSDLLVILSTLRSKHSTVYLFEHHLVSTKACAVRQRGHPTDLQHPDWLWDDFLCPHQPTVGTLQKHQAALKYAIPPQALNFITPHERAEKDSSFLQEHQATTVAWAGDIVWCSECWSKGDMDINILVMLN